MCWRRLFLSQVVCLSAGLLASIKYADVNKNRPLIIELAVNNAKAKASKEAAKLRAREAKANNKKRK